MILFAGMGVAKGQPRVFSRHCSAHGAFEKREERGGDVEVV